MRTHPCSTGEAGEWKRAFACRHDDPALPTQPPHVMAMQGVHVCRAGLTRRSWVMSYRPWSRKHSTPPGRSAANAARSTAGMAPSRSAPSVNTSSTASARAPARQGPARRAPARAAAGRAPARPQHDAAQRRRAEPLHDGRAEQLESRRGAECAHCERACARPAHARAAAWQGACPMCLSCQQASPAGPSSMQLSEPMPQEKVRLLMHAHLACNLPPGS